MPSSPLSSKTLMIKTDTTAALSSRKSRLKYDFPIETLIALSHFRQDEAAKILGVASITLKRNCQRHNYRWPYRTIKAKRRREAHLAAKNLSDDKIVRQTSSPAPEILLSLRNVAIHRSHLPMAVNGKAAATINRAFSSSMVPFPTTKVVRACQPMTSDRPPQLPPLSVLLQNLQQRSLPATPPRLQTVIEYVHHHPVEHKNSSYSASFHPTAPKFPLRNLSALADHC
uniref:RWP-RK domain-containing protein n=1 Tax=Peronospora matthiolae TaxID=2874970 RepID=A0AAV1TAY6_9STRA